jgi:E3 ubiquitin-protein ligase RNF115/126
MTGLMAALGGANMPGHTHEGPDAHQREAQGRGEMAPPFLGLLQSMGLIPGGGQMGDFVYSQEGLDRIVSQLMEQTATSNAPGPAPQADIDALPRRHVTEDMLGPEHRAECSICMDEVNIGGEVTELPCKHWFHHMCVSAWLAEHDTCPHCRQSISKHEGETNPASPPGGHASAGAQSTGSRTMPGSFDDDVEGEGTSHNPYMVRADAGSANAGSSQGGAADTQAEGGGVRGGLFGPQS